MATLNVQQMAPAGITPTYAAADGTGDEFEWGRYVFLHVKNGDTADHTVTVAEQHSSAPAGYQEADLVVTVPNGGEQMIGPLDRQAYQDANGLVQVSYDAVTSVTIAAVEMPEN